MITSLQQCIYLPIYLPIYLSVCQSLSVCLSIYLYIYASTHLCIQAQNIAQLNVKLKLPQHMNLQVHKSMLLCQ